MLSFYRSITRLLLVLSIVYAEQILMFLCRTYGRWVAANPAFVLCMSLAIAFVLCLGVIRFKVETRPEKV